MRSDRAMVMAASIGVIRGESGEYDEAMLIT